MAEELGAAVLRIDVDIESLQAQLNAARKIVERQQPFKFQIDTGTSAQQFRQLEASAKTLEAEFKRLLSTPLNLNSAGLRKLGEDAVTAGLQINDFARAIVNGNKPLATSIAALQQQSSAFRTLAANVKIGTAEYTNFTQAAVKAEQKQLLAGFTDIDATRKLFAGGSGSFADAFKGTDELLEFAKRVKDSPAAIKLYVQALQQAADVTSITDTNFAKLNAEIDRQTNALERAQQAAKRYSQIFNLTNQPKALPPGRGPGPFVFSGTQTPEERRAQEGAARRAAKIAGIQESQTGATPGADFPTLQRDLDRLQGLEFRLNNAKKGSEEYEKVLRLLTLAQRNFANAVEQSNKALATQQTAAGGFREFSQSANDPFQKSIDRNRRKQAQRQEREDATQARFQADLDRARAQRLEREQAAQDTFESDLSRVRERRTQAEAAQAARSQRREALRGRAGDALSNALIGGAFPALFGQGIGASLGGATLGGAGGLIGGQFGFGLSLIGTALGAQFDEAINKSRLLGQALNDPIGQFDALKQAALVSSKALERQADGLIKTGREAEAAALIQADLVASFGNLTGFKNLNTAFDELTRTLARLSVSVINFAAGPLTDFLNKLNASLTVPQAQQLQNQRIAEQAVSQNLTPLQRSLGVTGEVTFRGKKYRGNATDISQAIQGDLNNRSLQAIRGGTEQRVAALASPEQEAAQERRSKILTTELQLIAAQTQGYERLTLQRQKDLSVAKEQDDIENLKARGATQPELDARRTQGLREQVAIQEQLNERERKSLVLQQTSPAILKQSLAVIDAQARGAQRQAIIEERRLATLETERQLRLEGNRDPVRRGEIVDQGLLTQARLTAQLNQLDKERAAFTRQTTFDAREQGQVAQRQLAFARQRLGLETGIARQTLEQREAVIESIAAARDRQKRAQFSFTEALRQGGDTGQQRAFEIASKDIPEAARQLQLSLINGATALKDAGREISRSIEDNARALQDLYLTSQFATGEQRQQALTDLDRQVQAEAERRNIRFTVSGTEQERIAAKQAFLGFGRQETELLNQSRQLADALAIATKPIVDSNAGLIGSQATLIEAINTLSQKDWNVNVAVASDGTVKPAGDLVPSYL